MSETPQLARRDGAASPYRATVLEPTARTIAHGRRPRELDVAFALLLVAVVVVAARPLDVLVPFVMFWFLTLGVMLLQYRRGTTGVHRIDADTRGIRLRCNEAALAQVLSVPHPRAVDLFIPWAECVSIAAQSHRFGDDVDVALVITTTTDVIAVRSGVFRDAPERIARELEAARTQLALPP